MKLEKTEQYSSQVPGIPIQAAGFSQNKTFQIKFCSPYKYNFDANKALNRMRFCLNWAPRTLRMTSQPSACQNQCRDCCWFLWGRSWDPLVPRSLFGRWHLLALPAELMGFLSLQRCAVLTVVSTKCILFLIVALLVNLVVYPLIIIV